MNKKNILIAATVLGLFASSCKKDEFNANRLQGTWTINEYKIGNTDVLSDSLSTNIDGGGTIKTGFASASILFEEDGDFTENINFGFSVGYGGYSYGGYSNLNATAKGLWSCLNTDLLMSFETTYEYGGNYDYDDILTLRSSPMNSPVVTGDIYGTITTERYDIIKLTKSELEMQGTNSEGTIISIKATKN
jgi:hypothetical protein